MVSLILLAIAASAVASPPPSTEVSRLGSAFVSAGRSDGLSIALVKDGKVAFFNFGSVLPTEQTVYEIGSITKVFTSLLLAHAVTEGRINLQDDIRRYLPGDYPNLSWNGKPVHVIDLADTTSALPDNLPDFSKIQGAVLLTKALQQYSRQNFLHDLTSVKLVDLPGKSPRHSNLAAELLGVILEKVYGDTYQSLLARYVEQPFRMQPGIGEARAALLATGYDSRHVAMPATNEASIMAAGGLRYSTSDMARFLSAELASDGEAMQLSQKPAWGDPASAAVAFNWNLTRNVDNQLRLHASGGTLGFASYIEVYPALGYGIVLLTNRSGETESMLQNLAQDVFDKVIGEPALDALRSALEQANYHDVQKVVATVRMRYPNLHLTELYVNQWAGGLLSNRPVAAIALSKYNTEKWPNSSDASESLGYAYEVSGDKRRAVEQYRLALKLDPGNGEAAEGLKRLTY